MLSQSERVRNLAYDQFAVPGALQEVVEYLVTAAHESAFVRIVGLCEQRTVHPEETGEDVVASVAGPKAEEVEEVAVAPDLSSIEVEKKGKKEEEGDVAAAE